MRVHAQVLFAFVPVGVLAIRHLCSSDEQAMQFELAPEAMITGACSLCVCVCAGLVICLAGPVFDLLLPCFKFILQHVFQSVSLFALALQSQRLGSPELVTVQGA